MEVKDHLKSFPINQSTKVERAKRTLHDFQKEFLLSFLKRNISIKTVAICIPRKKTVWQPMEIWIRFEKVSHNQGSQSESEMTFSCERALRNRLNMSVLHDEQWKVRSLVLPLQENKKSTVPTLCISHLVSSSSWPPVGSVEVTPLKVGLKSFRPRRQISDVLLLFEPQISLSLAYKLFLIFNHVGWFMKPFIQLYYKFIETE